MIIDKMNSFCATGNFPYKALNNPKLLSMVSNQFYSPVHAILIPTNRCNLHCPFCCCEDRVKSEELSFDQIQYILDNLQSYNTKAITISGGGEPTLHPLFTEIINEILSHDMSIGLVTNGSHMRMLHSFPKGTFEWCRISLGDGRSASEANRILSDTESLLREGIIKLVGVSYVITETPDLRLINHLAQTIDKSSITYLKFIMDERNCENIEYPFEIRTLNCWKKILSPIQHSSISNVTCLLNLIKPIFAADGFVYPCCEIQYNNSDGLLCYAKDRKISSYKEYFLNLPRQEGYYSSCCNKCFHSTLVNYLSSTKNSYVHPDWI